MAENADETSLPSGDPSSRPSDHLTGSRRQGCLVKAVLYIGVAALVIGVLIYFAARSFGGGLAGSLVLALISWPFFEGAWSVVRAIGRLQVRVTPRHATIGGCLGIILLCAAGGLVWIAGGWAILGLSVGVVVTYLNRRTGLVTWPQRLGFQRVSKPTARPPMPSSPEIVIKVVAGFACLLIGVVTGVLGIGRYLEAYSVATDYGCAHPCGMVDGLWVEVTHDSQGRVVTMLDTNTVRLQVQFRDDTPGDKTIERSDFRLFSANTNYDQRTDLPGCSPWQPQAIRLDGSTGNLPVCFAISEADNVDFSKLVLKWTQQGRTVDISLGAPKPNGYTEIGVTPSPSPP
jgi:hypothetical protein